MPETDRPDKRISFDYRNHRGELTQRCVVPVILYWGTTEYYPEHQWILKAWDMDKKCTRDFAVRNIVGIGQLKEMG